jgi:hypothetical protein
MMDMSMMLGISRVIAALTEQLDADGRERAAVKIEKFDGDESARIFYVTAAKAVRDFKPEAA